MTWTLTATGRVFDLRYPQHQQITIDDVAHHLAQINRFTGAARRPYSVAEHSLLVCEICERMMPRMDVHGLMAALLHDAHEAYTNDLSTPAKREVEGWTLFEHRMERTVRSAFGVHAAAHDHRDAVKAADLIALATERAQLLPEHSMPWEVLMHVQPIHWVDLMSTEREAMSWRDWRNRFEDRFEELEFARGELLHPVAQP